MTTETQNKWFQNGIRKLGELWNKPQTRWLIDTIVIAAIVGITMFILGPNLDANWWIIDDHEMKYFTGSDQAIGFSEILPTLLTKTEISPDSTLARFRPAYYFLRLVETRLWDKETPIGWYTARVAVFVFFILILYFFFRKINGQITGALLAILVTSFAFWADIFSRLGPSEVYCVFSVALFLLGVLLYWKKKESFFAWLLMMLAVMIAIGSKENMVILLLPFYYIFITYLSAKPGRKVFPIISVGISTLWSIWVCLMVVKKLRIGGSDVYSNSVNIFERFSYIGVYISKHPFLMLCLGLLLIAGLVGLILKKPQPLKPFYKAAFFGSSFILILIFSQQLFYSGLIWGRYNFPLMLYQPFLICLSLYLLQSLVRLSKRSSLLAVLNLLAVVGLLFIIKPANWTTVHNQSGFNAVRTYEFSKKLDQIEYHLTTNPDTQIILYGNNANNDYEATESYSRFIRAMGFTNPIYILRDLPADYKTLYEPARVKLEEEMVQYSRDGSEEWETTPFTAEPIDPASCLLITLKVDHASPIECDNVIDGDVLIQHPSYFK